MGLGKRGLLFTFCVTKNLGESPSDSGVGHCLNSPLSNPPPPPSNQAFLLPPTPPHSREGGLELGRGLSRALKGSLSKGGRLNWILSTQLWSLGVGC